MEIIETILYILIVVAAVIMILLTLAQSNKGSDLGLFGGSTDMVFGSQKGNILTRTTAVLATILIFGTFLMGIIRVHITKANLPPKKEVIQKVKTIKDIESMDAKDATKNTKEDVTESGKTKKEDAK